jgi:tRNA(Ile2)-agmatinylcytidine synthase
MYVAVDDTDSTEGNCTTFLATEIIRELTDLDLIGNPRLVRLNPATPWKTRGNGSLIMRFGKGVGTKRLIGNIGGRDIYCFDRMRSFEPNEDDLLRRIIPLIEKNHEPTADPGLIISKNKPSQRFYWNGVRTIMDRQIIEDEILRIGAKKFEIGNGRGVIGCICGMAWRPRDSTYELLTYRPRERWGTKRRYDPLSIRDAEHYISTSFNSWEDRAEKVAMVPSTPCPVMYGFRGDVPDDLIKGYRMIKTESLDRWVIFLTNQGTDDHIIHNSKILIPNQSYYFEGRVVSLSEHIKGGHVFIDIITRYGEVTCGAYEPSKEFRYVLDNLRIGDNIGVMGELRENPRTLNIEKIHVLEVVESFEKVSNPICPVCGRTMGSAGNGQEFRCKKCHTRAKDPVIVRSKRWIVTGWYEPPTSARRHLSKPLKRMGEEQPIDFVNCRSQ